MIQTKAIQKVKKDKKSYKYKHKDRVYFESKEELAKKVFEKKIKQNKIAE